MERASSLDPEVLAYYEEGREQARLLTSCRLEFIRTQELLGRFLPQPPALIVDVGGGAGAHAIALQQRGYEVNLVDPVALHVEQARNAGVNYAAVGDARHLPLDDGTADAVLMLGPLYHLIERKDRVAALREARRVVGYGPVLAVVSSRFASTYDGLVGGFLADSHFEEMVERDLAAGIHLNPDRQPGWFTTAYFHRLEEVASEFVDAGLAVDAILAVEGPAVALADVDQWLDDPSRREPLLRAIRRVEQEPALIGASAHILVVGRAAGANG